MSKKLPSRRSKAEFIPDEVKEAESKFFRCPKGHALPHRSNRGECTPIHCAGGAAQSATSKAKAKKSTAALMKSQASELLGVEDLGAAEDDAAARAVRKITEAHSRFAARQAYLKYPEQFKDDKEFEAWWEKKQLDLLPLTVGDIEYALKLGDVTERERARKDLLDMTGRGRREAAVMKTLPQIIFQFPAPAVGAGPWVRRVESEALPPGGKPDGSEE